MSGGAAGDKGAELSEEDAVRLQECVTGGGVAVFPCDTVYGLCCDPENEQAALRLYELKRRPPDRPAAVMFFTLGAALQALPELPDAEREALRALLPGPVTLVLSHRGGRFRPASGLHPGERGAAATLGLRVPRLPQRILALSAVTVAVMQSSANVSGEPDARRLQDIPRHLLEGADLVLDGGELPGTPSTVIDLRDYLATGAWSIRREGAMAAAEVARLLEGTR